MSFCLRVSRRANDCKAEGKGAEEYIAYWDSVDLDEVMQGYCMATAVAPAGAALRQRGHRAARQHDVRTESAKKQANNANNA